MNLFQKNREGHVLSFIFNDMMLTMEKLYRAKRHLRRRSYLAIMHGFAWLIVCLTIAAVFLGLWTQSQTLAHQNNDLKQQVASLRLQTLLKDPASTCKVTGNWAANSTTKQSLQIAGQQREYFVHMPDNFENGKYYPILMFYVGRGASAEGGEAAYKLDQLPAIVVYPQPTMGGQEMTAWEGAPYSSGADDVAFTSGIIGNLQTNLCTDRTRVYAAGLSNGGGFAALLACKLPGAFAAYAVVAGATYSPEDTCKPVQPAPLISIHGDSDTTVPYYGSLIRHLPPVESWIQMRADYNNCADPTTTYNGSNVVITAWNHCENDAKVENVRIQGGEHGWGAVSNDFLWQFLAQYTL